LVLGRIAFWPALLHGAGPATEHHEKRIEADRKAAVRVNGAQLRATVEVRKTREDTEILLHWSLDYTGPRQPLIILKPTLDDPYYGECAVVFHAIGFDGKDYPITLHPPSFRDPFLNPDKTFITVRPGEVGRGTLIVSAARVTKEIRKEWAVQFGKAAPRHLYAQILHTPWQRGAGKHSDAWTGELQTQWLTVPLKDLKFD
jgi:hypothetical protein